MQEMAVSRMGNSNNVVSFYRKKNGTTAKPARKSFDKEYYSGLSNVELVKVCSETTQPLAWEAFYQRFNRFIMLYLKKAFKIRMRYISNGQTPSQEILSDISQEVYIKLIENDQQALRRFNGNSDLSVLSYLARISFNLVNEYFRKQNSEKRKGFFIPIDDLLTEGTNERLNNFSFQYRDKSNNIEEQLINTIAIDDLLELLNECLNGSNSERDKYIFQLYLIEGFTFQQIARIPGINLKRNSLESIIIRIQNKLTQAILKRAANRKAGLATAQKSLQLNYDCA